MEFEFIFFVFILVFIISIVICIKQFLKIRELKEKEAYIKKEFEKIRGKLSMIEYYHRNYREGKNPFTMLRKMADVLQGYEDYENRK